MAYLGKIAMHPRLNDRFCIVPPKVTKRTTFGGFPQDFSKEDVVAALRNAGNVVEGDDVYGEVVTF